MLCTHQVVIFVKSVARAKVLNQLLNECNFPSVCIYGGMDQEERIKVRGQGGGAGEDDRRRGRRSVWGLGRGGRGCIAGRGAGKHASRGSGVCLCKGMETGSVGRERWPEVHRAHVAVPHTGAP